jgi:excisionase family DNA binding protein
MDKRFLDDCLCKGMSLEAMKATGAARHAPKGGLKRSELKSLVDEGLTIGGMAQRLGIGDTTVRRWLKRHELRTHAGQRRAALNAATRGGERRDVYVRCSKHGLSRHVPVASERRLRCANCRSEAVSRRRRKVKEILVQEAGGKCVACGYNRHSAALQFHHLDPAKKSFGLGVRGITRSLARLREEAAKCVLLCANCHAELEAGAIELPVKFVPPALVRGGNSD